MVHIPKTSFIFAKSLHIIEKEFRSRRLAGLLFLLYDSK